MAFPSAPGRCSSRFRDRKVVAVAFLAVAFFAAASGRAETPSRDNPRPPNSGDTSAPDDKASPGDVAPASTIGWLLDASHVALPAEGENLYLRFRIDTSRAAAQERPPLTLVLVLDRSNSMSVDSKLEYVKKAAHVVAENLTSRDYVALVTYHTEIQTLVPMHQVVNHEYLHHRIDEMEPDGYTNISGGFLEGMAQMRVRDGAPGIHHVILLTDGVANRGITDPDQLVAMVRRAHDRGMTVSTIGMGEEHDEAVLTRMAQAGGGRYSYVARPDQIPNFIRSELGSMLGVVGQNAKLTLDVPAGLKVEQIFGREEAIKQGQVEIPLGDLTAGMDRTLLVRLRRDSAVALSGSTMSIKAVLTFDDVGNDRRERSEQTIALDGRPVRSAPLSEVSAYGRLVEAVDKIALAVKGMDRTLAADVLRFRQQQFPVLKQSALASGDQEFVNKAFMFEHYCSDLAELIEQGALHEHSEARAQLQKDLHYRRYMMEHHAHSHSH